MQQLLLMEKHIIKDYLIQGFAMDDERLKNNNNPLYFEELLARIREIRRISRKLKI